MYIATSNAHKVAEIRRILLALGVAADVQTPPRQLVVAETEDSFMGNALLKARAYANEFGEPALADDSGLCVAALNDLPGVLSARWAGRDATDAANVDLLLDQLNGLPNAERDARFVCAVALVHPDGREFSAEGIVNGEIVGAPRGKNGFGYDPIFKPRGYQVTTAEMPEDVKDSLSHRFHALKGLAARNAFD
jgi:XTP/dITP diphosphohydrolase